MAQTDRRSGVTEGQAVKSACRAATTAAITLSGEQTIDGVAVVADDRVLVKNQTSGVDNGIYVAATGNWTRAKDFDGNNDVVNGTRVLVISGTVNALTEWYVSTASPITVDTTSITFSDLSAALLSLDDDLTALAALSGTNTIYYRSAANTWSAVTIGSLLSFSGGTLNITDAELAAIAGLTSAADLGIQFTGSGTAATYSLTAAGKALLDDADAAAQRTTLGLVIGTNVQAYNARLADIAGITYAQGDILYHNGSNVVNLGPGTTGQILKTLGAAANPLWVDQTSVIAVIIDGGGSAITTGVKADIEIPFACTIERATTLADQTGSIVVDIWKDTYANFPPTVADTITASAKPTLSGADKAQDSTLTGWTTSITAGDTLRFNVDSAATVTRVIISLKVRKT